LSTLSRLSSAPMALLELSECLLLRWRSTVRGRRLFGGLTCRRTARTRR